jgi:hypothetical protein
MPPKDLHKLFPDARQFGNYTALRKYVSQRLVDMANAGTLFLTDCLNQGEPVNSIVGDVILGYAIENQEHQTGQHVPLELEEYRVKIRAIPHLVQIDIEHPDGSFSSRFEEQVTPIAYRLGSEQADDSDVYPAARLHNVGAGNRDGTPMISYRPRIIETGKTEVTLPLKHAVWCLRGQGKNVKRAVRRAVQRLWWNVEEVPPWEVKPVEEKRGPGRPKKQQPQVSHAR